MIPQAPESRRALIGEYVLGLLEEPEASEVSELIESDQAAARMALEWEQHLLELADQLPAQAPSPLFWQRLQQSLGWSTNTPTGASSGLSQWWNNLGLWRLTSGALAFLLILSLMPALWREAPSMASYTAVLQTPGESAQPGWVVTIDDSGTLKLESLVVDQIPAGRSVQFWTLIDPKEGPRSLGLIEPGTVTTLSAEQIGAVQAGQLFELTLEPEGGSPLNRPTGPVLYIGRAVLIASN